MESRAYEVTRVNEFCDDYIVYVNGKQVELNSARVVLKPYNQNFSGNQKPINQTEIVNFLSMTISSKTDFKIIPKIKSKKVVIKPQSLNITPNIDNEGVITFSLDKPAYFTVEPYERSHPLTIFAESYKEYNIDKNAENVLYFGKGIHDVGTINLKSNQILFVDEGAVVFATIRAKNIQNVKIIGKGIIDNSKNKEKMQFEEEAYVANFSLAENVHREYGCFFEKCKNITIEGVTFLNPLVYTIVFESCKNILVDGIKIFGCYRYNSDGVHFVCCENGKILNSFIRTFDDCLCVRGCGGDVYHENHNKYCKNIEIANCTFWNDWGVVIRVGAGTIVKEIKNIFIHDCELIHISIIGFDFCLCDYANVHDFTYKNINIEYEKFFDDPTIDKGDGLTFEEASKGKEFFPPLVLVAIYNHPEYTNRTHVSGEERGLIHDIHFENLHIYGHQEVMFAFDGYDEDHKIKNISLKHIYKHDNDGEVKKMFTTKVNEFVENIVIKK